MKIPFTKAHGAKNDFLLTWRRDAPPSDHAGIARAICDRHTGRGRGRLDAGGAGPEVDGCIQLYNSDGSTAEISGNGTRCAAAFLIQNGCEAEAVRVRTGAGVKTATPVGAQRLALRVRNEHGLPGDGAKAFSIAAFHRAARRYALVCGQPAVRRAGGGFRVRLARMERRSSRIRSFRTAPTSRFSEPWTSTSSRRGSMSVGRARP